MEALDAAMGLSKACQATLVALALVRVKAKRHRSEPRLEYVMQAKDFLEAVHWKAARYGVPIERYEVLTEDVIQSLDVLTWQLSCSGLVLFIREGRGVLLSTNEISCLVEEVDCTSYIVHLKAKSHPLLKRLSLLSSWLLRRTGLPVGEPALLQSPGQSLEPGRGESRREEVRAEDLQEDQRMHSHG